MDLEQIMDVVCDEDFDVTLTGGDPLFNPVSTLTLVKAVKEAGYGIWLYTGFTFSQIMEREDLRAVLPFIDALVDGPYIASLRDPDLPFRGSSNQNILLRPHSLLPS